MSRSADGTDVRAAAARCTPARALVSACTSAVRRSAIGAASRAAAARRAKSAARAALARTDPGAPACTPPNGSSAVRIVWLVPAIPAAAAAASIAARARPGSW